MPKNQLVDTQQKTETRIQIAKIFPDNLQMFPKNVALK